MEKKDFIGVRVSPSLKRALERERKRLSKATGLDASASDVVRLALEERFEKRRASAGRRAA